jgi:23S rRNA pseudouridine955/2504/2580 synthase
MAGLEVKSVEAGEAGMRLDRWFKSHYPGLGFGHLQKLLRSGQVRIDGSRAKADTRIQPGQAIRVPPLGIDEKGNGHLTAKTIRGQDDGDLLAKMLIHEDDKVYVFNKPAGLAVQGGSNVTRHVDGMLEAWRNKKGEKPRLVHRLDRDTSGVLVVARSRLAAMKLAESFRHRNTEKTYWALVKGVPKQRDGRMSSWLVK